MAKFDWLEKRTPRSVDQLRLWPENPRLNPEEQHIQLSDYAEDLIADESEKKQFFKLVKSIVEDTFVPADPIVVWKNEQNEKFYVAEGNRRVLALKLLREPHKAPKSIRGFIREQAAKIDQSSIEKINVNVAPTFEDAEWYINQRNSTSSLQQPWSRVQQQRWISELYNKYDGDIEKIVSVTKLTKGELESFIRILKIKDLVKLEYIKAKLSEVEFSEAISYKFPITILERFFSSKDVKDRWGVDFDGIDVKFKNEIGFYDAYAELIKHIVNKESDLKIDTRTITSDIEEILNKLPKVELADSFEEKNIQSTDAKEAENNSETKANLPAFTFSLNNNKSVITPPPVIKNNPDRSRLVLNIYTLNTTSYRLNGLFNELKHIPLKYHNSIASSIRIFLDLAVLNYLHTENLMGELCKSYPNAGGPNEIGLSKRLEFIKPKLTKTKSKDIINKILNEKNELSLNVLNGYVHSDSTHYLTSSFLNRFWDLLFPLFEEILDIKEND